MFTLDLYLSQIVLLYQGEHKPDKAEDVEGKRYQSMVSHQEGEEVYLHGGLFLILMSELISV